MNRYEKDILQTILSKSIINEHILVETSDYSMEIVNRSIKSLIEQGYIDVWRQPTLKAVRESKAHAPKNAIILAAGFGMRMVPVGHEVPKAMLEVKGESLIERQIRQLHEVGISDITVIVGFMKERFEYLIDEFGVRLIVNTDYAEKNNLHSLALTADRISNTYIVPCDIWCYRNPFNSCEMYSWYMVSDQLDNASDVRVNSKMELITTAHEGGNTMVGITYLLKKDSAIVRERLRAFDMDLEHTQDFWEISLYSAGKMLIEAKVVHAADIVEINTYEQLRGLDSDSSHLKSNAIDVISRTFQVSAKGIRDISVLKKGMTNHSFLFTVKNEKYIMRIPGEGTGQLISREKEWEVLSAIAGKGLCDDPVYLNPKNGYKITKFLKGVRTADAFCLADVKRCMKKLVEFHEMRIKVGHTFDIFRQIDFYEGLWGGKPSVYRDYRQTKDHVMSLELFISSLEKEWCLTHIDAVADNFLFYMDNGTEKLQLTDWEYSGMQDPHVDIAMFCIYSLYDRKQTDELISIYFEAAGCLCDKVTRVKIYAYIAACGLLWSNWCEYKSCLGIEFGEYSVGQYRYAKDYYRYVMDELGQEGETGCGKNKEGNFYCGGRREAATAGDAGDTETADCSAGETDA